MIHTTEHCKFWIETVIVLINDVMILYFLRQKSFLQKAEEESSPLNKTERIPLIPEKEENSTWFWFCPFCPMSPAIQQHSGYMSKRPQGKWRSWKDGQEMAVNGSKCPNHTEHLLSKQICLHCETSRTNWVHLCPQHYVSIHM